MKVLIWTELYWPSLGGTELFTMNLVNGLHRRGLEFQVVTGHPSESLPLIDEVDGIAVQRLRFRAAFEKHDLSALHQVREALFRCVRAFQPDLVHMTWLASCGVFYHQLQDAYPIPTLISLGQHLRGDLSTKSLRGRTLRRANWVAACSSWMHESLLAAVPELRQRTSVVYHAVPPSLAPADTVPDGERLLCLGRLANCKGFDVALEAFALLATRRPKSHLVIAGDGPERTRLEALAADLGIAQRVSFLGMIPPADTAAVIAQSAIVVMPSTEETFGLVALEAAQQGRPVVASRIEGLAEVVADGESGRLVAPGDSGALATAMLELLDDASLRERLGRQAEERAVRQFSWTAHLDAYEELYRRLAVSAQR
ncbi:MAG TPA: glycosyltransferase family 4 protein [Candidatus Acidoferrales bacterium]|nr:glycosyltransferase family 4 protein [Candidatus Acidoferrales bacterium]